jgi:Cys-rich four helix bundle protein (predicted Tat secretion target)
MPLARRFHVYAMDFLWHGASHTDGFEPDELVTICTALQKLAIHDSPNTLRFAKLAADACADCEKQCRKFQTKHAQCKACADACAGCIKECQKLSA